MKIGIMGAGGIGGFYGALLVRAGEEVALIARGEHLAAIRDGGLTVIWDEETFTVTPAHATDDPAQVGPCDLVLVTTKAYDLAGAARTLAPMLGAGTVVLPLLNGVDINRRLAEVLGPESLLAGTTYVPVNRPHPGVVHHRGEQRRLVFGEEQGPPTERCLAILEVLVRAGINADLSGDMPREIWSKFMLVNANGGVCGVTGLAVAPVLADPDTRALYEASCREVQALAESQGIALDADIVERNLHLGEILPPDVKPSLLQDLEAGKPLELDILCGTVARLGRELGVPVPVNTMLHAALKHRENG